MGQIIVGENGQGKQLNQLDRPTHMIIDKDDNSLDYREVHMKKNSLSVCLSVRVWQSQRPKAKETSILATISC